MNINPHIHTSHTFTNLNSTVYDTKFGSPEKISVSRLLTCLGLIGGRIFNTQCLDLCEMCSITRHDLEEACYGYPTAMNTVESHARKALKNITRKLDLESVTGTLKILAKRRDLVRTTITLSFCKLNIITQTQQTGHERQLDW